MTWPWSSCLSHTLGDSLTNCVVFEKWLGWTFLTEAERQNFGWSFLKGLFVTLAEGQTCCMLTSYICFFVHEVIEGNKCWARRSFQSHRFPDLWWKGLCRVGHLFYICSLLGSFNFLCQLEHTVSVFTETQLQWGVLWVQGFWKCWGRWDIPHGRDDLHSPQFIMMWGSRDRHCWILGATTRVK